MLDRAESPTPRELEVICLAASNLSTAQIASELHISYETAATHLWSLHKKLGVNKRVGAVIRAHQLGWININNIEVQA